MTDLMIEIARYIEAHPFITERELTAAGYSREDLVRTAARTIGTRNCRPYGRTFYVVQR